MKLKHSDTYSSAKAITGFLVLCVAVVIFVIFAATKDDIIDGNMFQTFILLTAVGMALLLTLLYMANQTKATPRSSKRRKR